MTSRGAANVVKTPVVSSPIKGDTVAVETDAPNEEVGLLFHYLNPRDPQKARRRFGKLYWVAWKRLVMAFFLSAFGTTFLIVGLLCTMHCTDFDRGIAFFFIGLLMALPGFYAMATLIFYLQGRKGYSYKMLPDYE
ncbi:transmembrane protein, putative [Bodo saltans]|uniref:Transmembrane protein 230 n=1 Tax=Bodo saltans TaxID=75058 RepID=A0A0S4ITN0_BODSA|nr:transmembrane protein, putative [Bodo saltans]|eukprot:CUF85011.1 transmembrane protein, putative [Bodo saltans]